MHGNHRGARSGPDIDPHYAGRAADIGAFGGTLVGMNKPTWDALVAAIASRRFSAIGTTAILATNPELLQFAADNGVRLRIDESNKGENPHVHFEVATR